MCHNGKTHDFYIKNLYSPVKFYLYRYLYLVQDFLPSPHLLFIIEVWIKPCCWHVLLSNLDMSHICAHTLYVVVLR